MSKLQVSIATVCFLLCAQYAAAQHDISLNQLSDCQGLATVQEILNHPISPYCRNARDPLETSVNSQFLVSSGVETCLLASPPTDRLSAFSCIEISSALSRELTCFRTVDKLAVNSYMSEYDSDYRETALNYLRAARKCSVSNGDATSAPNTLFPSFLKPVARGRFGFALQLGNERKSMAYHGYADLDPSLELGKDYALEVVDFLKTYIATAIPASPCDTQQGIVTTIEDSLEGARNMANVFHRTFGLPAVVKMRLLNFTYCGSKQISAGVKESDLDEWQSNVGDLLDHTSFRELTSTELEDTPFKSVDDLRDAIATHMPFGQDNSRVLGPHLLLRVDDRFQQCAAIAEVTVLEPEEGVKSDYGSIGIILAGLGQCYAAQRPSGTLSDQLLNEILQNLSDEVASK